MAWVETVIADFGKSIGLPNLRLGINNKVTLRIGARFHITISHHDKFPIPEILISNKIPASHIPYEQARYLLEISQYELAPQRVLQCSMNENYVIISTRIFERALSLNILESAIDNICSIEIR